MDFIDFMLDTEEDFLEYSALLDAQYSSTIVPRRRLKDWQNPVERLDDVEFRDRYRFTKQGLHEFLIIVKDDFAKPGSGAGLPAMHKILVFLRFVSSGSFQLLAGDLEKISQPTVSNIIKEVASVISNKIGLFVEWPTARLDQCKQDFHSIAGFPEVIGAIDCTHIRIQSPGGEIAERYRNRKGYFSINCQAVCDANLIFTNICARWYGSTHDSRIFDNSQLAAYLDSLPYTPGYLLGDQGYPLTPYLMTPLRVVNTRAEANYNKAHKKTRLTIERAFGVLKRIFSCLRTGLRLKLETTLKVIPACVALYNFLRQRNIVTEDEVQTEDEEDSELSAAPHHRHFARASAARQELINMHFAS